MNVHPYLFSECNVAYHDLIFCRMAVIYRDFALRNCLVSSDMTVKVGDYGLAEEIFKVKAWTCKCDSNCVVLVEKLIKFLSSQ